MALVLVMTVNNERFVAEVDPEELEEEGEGRWPLVKLINPMRFGEMPDPQQNAVRSMMAPIFASIHLGEIKARIAWHCVLQGTALGTMTKMHAESMKHDQASRAGLVLAGKDALQKSDLKRIH